MVVAFGCAPPTEDTAPDARAQALVQSTPSLSTGRMDHSTTKLANGKVLVAGGTGASGKLTSAEIYDPANNTWTATGSMQAARAAHTAVLLNDGTVLVTGGVSNGSILSSSERYDPATGSWSPAAPINHISWSHTATKLQDGRVLVTGGCPSPLSAAAQLFDPTTGAWTTTGSMTIARCNHRATLLLDGRVLITGGTDLQQDSNKAEIYDPATGAFTAVASSNTYKRPHQAVRLADGRVLTLSNWYPSGNEIYDPAANTWTVVAAAREQRNDQVAVLLSDESVMVAGGDPSSIERFSPSDGTWSVAGRTVGTRGNPGVAVLDDGRVMLVGGYRYNWTSCGTGCWSGSPYGIATSEIYTHDLSKGAAWSSTLGVPACLNVQSECDSVGLLYGKGIYDPELHQPNTIHGTCADGTIGGDATEAIQALRVRTPNGGPLQAGTTVIVQATVKEPGVDNASDVLDLYRAADANNPVWQFVATLPLDIGKGGLHDLSTTFVLPNVGSLQAIRGSFRHGGTAAPCTTNTYDDHDDLVFAVNPAPPDTTPPTVAFTSPAAGAITNGNVQVTATASDDYAVNRVEFYQGATLLFTDTSAPYSFAWSAPGGSITLTAKAYDDAGNVGTATVTFTSDRTPPSVSITAPAAGSTISGTVTVSASASDSSGISIVDFFMDGRYIGSDNTAPYSLAYSTVGWDGTRSFTARAYDLVNNSTLSAPVTVTVQNVFPGNATYDPALRTASCRQTGAACDSGTLFNGRAFLGPEPNQSNTINASCADGTAGGYHSDESLDRLRVYTVTGTPMKAGTSVNVEATVWAWAGYTSDQLDLYYAADATNPTWVYIGTMTPSGSGARVMTTTYTLPNSGTLQAVRGQFRYGSGSGPCTPGSFNDRDDLVFAVSP